MQRLINVFGEKAQSALDDMELYQINNAPKIIDKYSIYDLWHIIFEFDAEHLDKFATEKLKIQNKIVTRKKKQISISPLVELKEKFIQGYADLSLKALCKIIPFLKKGHLYNDAVILAKIPELLDTQWQEKRDLINEVLEKSNKLYNERKAIINIANNLIDKHKGLNHSEKFAYKDFEYALVPDDIEEIEKACVGYFGEKSWIKNKKKEEIIKEVGFEYQDYFHDTKRAYRKFPNFTEIFKDDLKENGINLKGELYHHSNRKNIYDNTLEINHETGEKYLPTYKDTGIEILPVPYIDSIKNPMFNKSMSILRKLINELIVAGEVDDNTEIIVELARELNDNNKRAAIERYQNLRKNNREKYREFLKEFKNRENINLNVEESISAFELWSEQTFEETNDENGKRISNKGHIEILNEKAALKRYELWMEQKGQCMYTGKMISITQLFSNDIDIMHTIPRWLLPDNTMANMTVGFSKYNRDLQKEKLPKQCDNYSVDVDGWGTSIEPRLEIWKKERDKWKSLFESRRKPKGNEDEEKKNKRIQEKHYFKMHLIYWNDKIERFEADEVKDSWARRQLVDTQMISRYAREYLKLYFKKVSVQKGTVTSDFRKLFGFQEEDEIKSRDKHTHHAIDASVLTLIPVNSSKREQILKNYFKSQEDKDKLSLKKLRASVKPSSDFNPQELIRKIEEKTLIVNYQKDKIINQSIKKVRKRGKIQYVKDKQGEFVLDKEGNRIIKYAKGDTLRSELFAQTYLGKIKDVERYDDSSPKRNTENTDWIYKKGKDEFIFVKRENIDKVKSSDKLIKSIIDPVIRNLVEEQKKNTIVKDYQGNVIRHIRIRTKSGREVKERINYRSRYDYKNKFYSEAGKIPYAVLLQKSINGEIEREMIPVASFEVAKVFKKHRKFNPELYMNEFHPDIGNWDKKIGLKLDKK
ncbi:CRISPR-associated protein [Jejuia pallidilutea]|uniref:CRISPR-associated protein n=1 Tax=Jejuia pallidilutea TaxID=504487 RepID=A0A090WNX4_9FLAO|nr:type II CRISPR RNA-guided endonuclease Cas9 [Jejuia pallidilutea]GAL69132.1 CRISPR-associated protein [Jejuia pallidilutea]